MRTSVGVASAYDDAVPFLHAGAWCDAMGFTPSYAHTASSFMHCAPIAVSVIAAVLAMPSSIIGKEAAIRFGRHPVIVLFMCLAGIVAILIGFATSAAPAVLLASVFI